MATENVKKSTNSIDISCPVCSQLFTKPKYLPCHHSYCELCLEKMQVQSRIICPKCKTEATVPTGGVKEFNTNFFITRLVDEFILKRKVLGEVEVKCDQCLEDDPVENFCPNCIMFLCHICNEYHKRSAKSRDHNTITLTQLRSNKDVCIQPKVKGLLCNEHEYELRHYCESCEELVCLYCTMKKHNGHNHDTVKNVIKKHRQELKKSTALIDEMIRGVSEAYDKIEETMKQQTKDKINELSKNIDQHYDEMVQKLMEQKETLKQQVRDTMSQPFKPQLEEVNHLKEEILRMEKFNDVVEDSSDQELLTVEKQIISDMQQLNEKYKKINLQATKPVTISSTIEFVPTKEPFPQLGLLYSTAKLDPQQSEIVGFPEYIFSGEFIEFTIITKDENGICCKGGSDMNAMLGKLHLHVKDNDDGSYVASTTLQHCCSGSVTLSLMVNGYWLSMYTIISCCF